MYVSLISYSYLSWTASEFSMWIIIIYNISKLRSISTIKTINNRMRIFIITAVLGLILTLILALPSVIGFNSRYGYCQLLTWSEVNNNIFLLLASLIFLIGLFVYFLESFMILPLTGFIIAKRILVIRKSSRELTKLTRQQTLIKTSVVTDTKIMISQLFNSCFAIAFNIPLLIASLLNLGNYNIVGITVSLLQYCIYYIRTEQEFSTLLIKFKSYNQ